VGFYHPSPLQIAGVPLYEPLSGLAMQAGADSGGAAVVALQRPVKTPICLFVASLAALQPLCCQGSLICVRVQCSITGDFRDAMEHLYALP
jgi:hypothetical protein